ncbi:ubiquinone/menaquinone [Saitoella complicata NRRL Y-17804]|uniref:2-methoxy-6-polyprenyl-1,4-benzoquinol methylase, mitochondrial n=1 Tax=Saitoella complicata (strain BCRC 22490 / CBS 7301 / JCM 7358 / NBRC 10748 / NRRL Y-17804) TaxID=698492 RepID=A0A0E9NAV3_SAICN|nr:ubiquinone/menaquinone [Saitoella complicata NRRL Y-17804]ODQ53801.1 ubiquinone/menaquinone [Saitoella complicata NRRL Y-17804]GAO47002.1 hypothetical protein G7K_1216-t1 [Saitoella complicata NRRL Y-17804]
MQRSRTLLPRLRSVRSSAFSTSSLRLQDSSQGKNEPKTHFGFKSIPESLKESLVGGVFSSVAPSYDVMNDTMSLGIHRLWKDHFVRRLDPGRGKGGMSILDVGGGTGDIAFRLLDHATDVHNDTTTKVMCVDINPDMLREGEKRSLKTRYANTERIKFQVQNAEELTAIPDASVDLYTIAFCIRNCTHIDAVLREAYRVLKPGGVFSCLEFAPAASLPGPLPLLYRQHLFKVIPLMGELVAGDRASYQYLSESIERFPMPDDFSRMIEEAGFNLAGRGWEPQTFGISYIHTGVKV